MSGALDMLMQGALAAARSFVVTVGASGANKGFNPALAIGSLAPAKYFDRAALRTVGAIYWNSVGVQLQLEIVGAGVPNTDATFKYIRIGATTLARTSAAYSGTGANSLWTWPVGDPFGASARVGMALQG